ncbi:MAG: hypothetical protein KatS3mg110_1271 [Pirellulaceae bacterium]|nr:MAG: hypothetical protein KatS3mg110_1271 [Pirellulaceae bacterium]
MKRDRRNFAWWWLPAAVGVVLLVVTGLWASAVQAAESVDVESPSMQTPARWVEQLRSPLFRERQEAMRRLAELGIPAIGLLEQAAQSSDAEVRSRALAVLERHLGSESSELRETARSALERLAGGSGPAARAAYAILNPPPEPSPADIQRRLLALQLAQIGRANGVPAVIPVQIAAKAVVNRSVSIQQANGLKIRIQQTGDQIKIEWTEPQTKDGQPVTRQAEAKNVEELQQQHPEAYKIYREYAPRFGLPLPKNPG